MTGGVNRFPPVGLMDFSVGEGEGGSEDDGVVVLDGLGVPLLSHAAVSPLITTSPATPAASGRRMQRRNSIT